MAPSQNDLKKSISHLDRAGAAFAGRHPGLQSLGSQILRSRLLLLAVAGLSVSLLNGRNESLGDYARFHIAGQTMLSLDWRNTFSDSFIQVGPLTLLYAAVVPEIGGLIGAGITDSLDAAYYILVPLATALVVRAVSVHRAPDLELYVGWMAVAGGFAQTSSNLFIEEAAVAFLWLLAGNAVRNHKPLLAGILLGASVAVKPWGLLGLPLLLALPDLRSLAQSLIPALSIPLVMLGPFFLWGNFSMLDRTWTVYHGVPLESLFGMSGAFTWPMRVVQATAAMGAGTLFILAFRRSRQLVWTVPMVIVAVRIALDPAVGGWYWIPVQILALVGAASLAARLPPLLRIPSALSLFLVIFPPAVITYGWLTLWTASAAAAASFSALFKRTSSNEPVYPVC